MHISPGQPDRPLYEHWMLPGTFPNEDRVPAAARAGTAGRSANAEWQRPRPADLARMELRVAVGAWLDRIPEFSLADPAAVTWSAGQIRGPRTLPLRIRT